MLRREPRPAPPPPVLTSGSRHDLTIRLCWRSAGIVTTADKVLSGPMPGVWDKSTAGTPIAIPGSSAGLMPAGQLRRSNVRDTRLPWKKSAGLVLHTAACRTNAY